MERFILPAAGREPACRNLPEKMAFEDLGEIRDDKIGDRAYRIHDICIASDGTIYAGENDNFRRSGYLWECRIE